MNKQLPFSMLIAAFALCSLFSCKQSSPRIKLLVHADSLLELAPDTALSYLRSLSLENFSKEEKAYYGLLLTSAMDKNYLSLLPCDSLVDAALDYYDEGAGYNRARALFYKERIQFTMKMSEEAMANCFEALKELNGHNDKEIKLKSKLYEDLGDWYIEQMIDDKALEMYRLSYYNDSLINNQEYMVYSLREIARVYACMFKPDSAVYFLKKALSIMPESNDSLIISNIYHDLSYITNNNDTALFYARIAIENLPQHAESSSFFNSLGELYYNAHNLDSAEFYLMEALKHGDINDRTLASKSLADIANEKGDYKLATNYYLNYVDLMDSLFDANQASNIERLAYKYEAEVDSFKKEKRMQQLILLIILGFVLVTFIGIICIQIVIRKRKIAQLIYEKESIHLKDKLTIMQSNIKRAEAEIELLQQVQSENKEIIQEKEKLVNKMIEEKAELRNYIFSKTPIYHLILKLSKQERDNKKEIRVLTLKEQTTLRKTIFEIYAEHVEYLHSTYTKLNEDDYLYCCLRLCKFDDYTIAYCFGNMNKQIVVQRRFRLKEKMGMR